MESAYDYICSLFKDLVFTKVEPKHEFYIYAAKIQSGLITGNRFVLLFVPQHLAMFEKANIKNLLWSNLQTRELSSGYTLKQQALHFPVDSPLFVVTKREETFTMFNIEQNIWKDFPFEVMLIHKKTGKLPASHMRLDALLESYSCVINKLPEVDGLSIDPTYK